MLSIKETESKLRDKLEKTYKKPGRGSTSSLDYLKVGAIAVAMNEAFGPCGWDVYLDKIEIVKDAHRINGAGIEDAGGSYWNAIAYAVVTVKARSLFRDDGTFVEVSRTDLGVGSSVGGKQKTAVDAIQNSLTSATTNALKRACRFFGPKTGLTLQFEPGERESVQRALDAASHANEEVDEIEGTVTETTDEIVVPDEAKTAPAAAPAPTAPAAAPAAQTQPVAAPATNGNGSSDHGVEVLASFTSPELLAKIRALAGPDAPLPPEDMKAFHKGMATTFGGHAAMGLWTSAGVTPGAGVVVRRRDIFGVAQVIEEASAGQGGLDGFLAQFRPAAPAAPAAAAPATPAPQPQPAPAPAAEQTTAPAAAASGSATHGEQVQQAWSESSLGSKDRLDKYTKLFGTRAPEVIQFLTATPDDAEVTKQDAAKIHSVGLKIIQEMNIPAAEVYTFWKKAGFAFGSGQPKGRQVREFADALPQ